MSRTFKTRPYKVRFRDDWDKDRLTVPYTRTAEDWYTKEPIEVPCHYYIQTPTTVPKKKRKVDTEERWMTTPSWWTRMTQNKPQRCKVRLWERQVQKTPIQADYCPTMVLDKETENALEQLETPPEKMATIWYW